VKRGMLDDFVREQITLATRILLGNSLSDLRDLSG